MSQHDFDIANQTASNARIDINLALKALGSLSSGSSAPSTTYANMLWYDTTNNTLKMRSEADDAWITLGTLDQSLNTFTPAGLTATSADPDFTVDPTLLANRATIATAIAAAIAAADIQFASLPTLVVGDTVKISQIGDAFTAGTIEKTLFSCGFVQAGSVRLTATYGRVSTLGTITITARVKRTRNGTTTTLLTVSTTGTSSAISIDIPVIPGDIVSITLQTTASDDIFRGFLSNTAVKTAGDDIWPASNSDMQNNLFTGYWS